MTTAVVNFEGVRVVITCDSWPDERCAEMVAILLDTTDLVGARRLVQEEEFVDSLEDIASMLGWHILTSQPAKHRCPKCANAGAPSS